MSSGLIASPSEPGLACPGCGWMEPLGATHCRSCGGAMGGADALRSPAPPADPADPPERPRSTPSKRSVSLPSRASWEAISALLRQRWIVGMLVVGVVIFQLAGNRPVTHPPGILIPEEPVQSPVPPGVESWKSGETQFRALASYSIKARVLHRERYRWDAMADLAPVDLGVGWGLMSDETHASRCSFSNASRYLNWWWTGTDFPAETATRSMANMHMIPATSRVRDRLLSLRPGQLFKASGQLVEVTRPGMTPWTSSLSRLDTGNGACEIMWVRSLVPLP